MSATMTNRRRKKQDRTKPSVEEAKQPQRSGVPLHVWLDEDLAGAFTAYIESTDPKVFRTSAVETALKDFLRTKGFWPPKTG